MKYGILGMLLFASIAQHSLAQTTESSADNIKSQIAQLQKAVKSLTETVKIQQKRITELETAQLQVNSKEASNTLSSNEATNISTGRDTFKPSGNYVPDIGVVADIVGSATQRSDDEEGNDRISLRELELIFGHDIDPYARLDAVVTFSDQEDPDVEEAYVTYWGLPWGVKGKIGRMRQRIGKASATHRDALDTVDEPFVIQRYFGAEGLFRSGAELSAFTPLSLDDFTNELVVGVMEGGTTDGDLFSDTRRHPTLYSHMANFWQLSDANSVELGGTYLLGSKNADSHLDLSAFGVDLTFLHYASAINKLKFQNEIYLQNRNSTEFTDVDGTLLRSNSNPFGFYTLLDYRLSERWGLGTRYDYLEPTNMGESWRNSENGYSGYLTFFESEFARWRFQYQRARLLEGDDDNRFFLQGTFAIGTHKHNLN